MKDPGHAVQGGILHAAAGRQWRGGERQVLLLARALAARGVPQLVATARGGPLAQRLRAEGLPVAELPWRLGLDPRAALGLRRLVRTAALVHAHDAHAVRLAAWARRGREVPLVVTRRLTRLVARPDAWRGAEAVIAISGAVRESLRRAGIAEARLHLVPSGIDLAAGRAAAPADLRARLALPPEAPLLLVIAALTPEKGHALALEVAARMRPAWPSAHWVFAGDGPLRAPLEREARARDVADVVRFAGRVNDVVPWLTEATLLVSPSREEALGTSLLDALAAGCPVVATAVGGVPEVLGGGAGLLVPPDDPAAMAAAIHEVLADPARRAALAAAGRERVTRFSLDAVAAGTLGVYRSVGWEG